MMKILEEGKNLNTEQGEPDISGDVLKERVAEIDNIYNQRIAEFNTVAERVFPHEDNKAGDFDKILATAKQKIAEEKGDASSGALSESERMALALEENRIWAEQQRAQELKDLQEIISRGIIK